MQPVGRPSQTATHREGRGNDYSLKAGVRIGTQGYGVAAVIGGLCSWDAPPDAGIDTGITTEDGGVDGAVPADAAVLS